MQKAKILSKRINVNKLARSVVGDRSSGVADHRRLLFSNICQSNPPYSWALEANLFGDVQLDQLNLLNNIRNLVESLSQLS